MINQYEPKPIEGMEFTGTNEGEIQSWLEGFGYKVKVDVNSAERLQIVVEQLNTTIIVNKGDCAVYWVGEILLQPASPTEIAARFDLLPAPGG